MEISRDEAVALIRNSKGKFINVVFVKRTNKAIRHMNCRTGVKKHLVESPKKKGINHKKCSLIPVWARDCNDYRCIPEEGIQKVKTGGVEYSVV